jgi:hypothetical protein
MPIGLAPDIETLRHSEFFRIEIGGRDHRNNLFTLEISIP